ncbi:MAG: ATP-binding protein [Bacteroidales bacterium]|nr:ATP-binding protein [Bacteroidales bacterium]MCI6644511.1 ATP-binding protein [Bacteroidales bacterium]
MKAYTFNISLSILNHLGRNLYRSFITVLGEAISNSWDADAKKVWIYIDRDNNTLVIKDDGLGMTENDFQNKFLKIGYSKRKDNATSTASGRPFIGRKGIGKLALLSCAKRITVLTKTANTDLVGGVIDNSGLDKAIKDDVSANEYSLIEPSKRIIEKYNKDFSNGTIILFDGINDGIKNRIEYIRKLVALYFRFSLLDSSFSIILNDNEIKLEELKELMDNTQLLWRINNPNDPYLRDYLEKQDTLKRKADLSIEGSSINGFIASVEKPSMLKIRGSEEKVSIDLYVNGRLREKDILKHIPTARIVESYLYGQIHYNDLDDENDRFTSSREGVVSDDPKFLNLLKEVEKLLKKIIEDWDVWRIELKQDGDSENKRIPPKERKSKELFNEISKDFIPTGTNEPNKKKVEKWVSELDEDATFNFSSYGECFISENLLRKYITDKGIALGDKQEEKVKEYRKKAKDAKNAANISFDIREDDNDLSYFAMDDLTYMVEPVSKGEIKKASLHRDAQEYKPIRDAMSHTSRLTKAAKNRLNATYENIKARIIYLLGKV